MITLTIIFVLYSIFGTIRFKKLYGHTDFFKEDPKFWVIMLVGTITISAVSGMFLILKYLP